jgi:DNA topoisomerase-1
MTRPNGSPPDPPPLEAAAAARAASLHYVTDQRPGYRRKGSAKRFRYVDPDGAPVNDQATLERIRALAIPPAWSQVWISRDPNGHLQATGRDARGRKQYRYHPRWRVVRDETKYGRMRQFGASLPKLRAAVAADLARPGLPREKVLATIVRLLETTFIRVGNDEYAKANGSFGLTTLRNRHVKVRGASIRFRFIGKSGQAHEIELNDRRLADLVRRCRDLPGQDLFQYQDEEGKPQPVSSADVNEYLRSVSGEEFTAKDFRTWAGTLIAAGNLPVARPFEGKTKGRRAMVAAAKLVAEDLRNTAAVCRKCYIHPAILDAYHDETLFERWKLAAATRRSPRGLRRSEAALLRFLAAAERPAKRKR